ncbi:EI24 domain-containing protein [uncultured Oxalicibacterium sp.]|uniref:EI24 domain-containing protein n=1 Tax=uncultured Oxalicibacterium sp. TaxID=1168540 RepID=UPI0025D45C4F|nr:EI24 domain-containing protein [uncultured Oxalicibacterium sp.]
MQAILIAFGRAVVSQLHIRMLLLTIMPFILSLAIWGLVLAFSLNAMMDWTQAFFLENDGFATANNVLTWFGLATLKAVVVPLLSMWILLPLMIFTALVFVGVVAMPFISSHVGGRHYKGLEKRKGGSFFGSLWMSLSSFAVFLVLWLVSLPLSLIIPFMVVAQVLLWGWVTYRVMAYDALADYADADERKAILRQHRWPLLCIGTLATLIGAAPMLLWLGGAVFVFFLPVFATGAIWLYVLVFVFTGLWFQHYVLQALASYRVEQGDFGPQDVVPLLDLPEVQGGTVITKTD